MKHARSHTMKKYNGNGLLDFFTKNRTQKKTHKKMKCGPMFVGKGVDGETCYTKKILQKIKMAYNRSHENKITTNRPDLILDTLKLRLKTVCPREDCWLKLLPESQQNFLQQRVFRPFHPKEWNDNPKEWLSNFDILKVLKQYEQSDDEFEFLGPSPIDFDKKIPDNSSNTKCVWSEICNFQLSKYIKKGTKKIGMVFNLDDHDESGSHWVSLYIDIPHKIIFYFDSALNDTPPEIEVLAQRILDQASRLTTSTTKPVVEGQRPSDQASRLTTSTTKPVVEGQTFVYQKNTVQHQFSNSECGMYSLFFLITLITEKWGGEGKPMSISACLQRFKTQRIPDKVVAKFREHYFNSPNI